MPLQIFEQLNGSSQATMEKTLEGVCIPSHRVAPSSLTGLKAGVSNPSQIFDDEQSQMHVFAMTILAALLAQPEPLSALRLSKRLGVRLSTLLRCLAYLGSAEIAGQPGLGWVESERDGERLLLSLTAAGRAACACRS
ncbi:MULTISPECIES: hypothetical protein [unclassified Undibacterium]|uniref:hypothetical protein n=1 Tax=unclassified Undibacterium TaxID=2630295 RepID=UPI002AC9396B|nr:MULTISPECIES: hypothetical protein [unclassified Undibacterium]MEB0138297.1 hypothetical protein [Undibacterium sp. CCC2.1]MEB0170783.1 hypothetical protein [Undibacterium sp. CCC1.1]MEB0174672.1 hypothetical protein [Undibacterium sp. CCC3.4]MEB0213869.1 hypothetical protein [Undibacterium sp. 5I2]WPX42595.1 hypothetical protein RHM61_14520 [Undibacterium sp. CCC3.4]